MSKSTVSEDLPKQEKPKVEVENASADTKQDSATATSPKVKICSVCGDKATGMHFGAMSCEGCKGFFRRSLKKNANFACAFDKKCAINGINKVNRRHCQACRLDACKAAGMQSELILNDEEVNKKRELIKHNREIRMEKQKLKRTEQEQLRLKKLADLGTEKPVKMSEDDQKFIDTLLKGHKESYDFGYEEFDTFRGNEQVKSPSIHSASNTLAWIVASLSQNNPSIQEKREDSSSPRSQNKDTSKTTEKERQDMSQVFSSLHGISSAGHSPLWNESGSDADQQSSSTQDQETSDESNPALTPEENEFLQSDADSIAYLRRLLRSQGFSLSMMEDSKSKQLLQHFFDIMTWGIKKVIDFCKSIPEFLDLSIVDQIVLLRGGCLEMLVLRSYFAFASDDNKYQSDKFQYKPSDFLQAGASSDFVEKYNSLHMRMRKMKLQVEEICLLLALVLFSPDRPGLENQELVEKVQDNVAKTLQAYEYSSKSQTEARTMYSELLLILPILRTINMLFAANLVSLQASNPGDMNPLILEVNSGTTDDE